MIKSITVTNHVGDSLKLELTRPELSGFYVKSITGLGPGQSTINISEVSTMDGGIYNSSRVSTRNIVISLGFLWKNTIEDARQLSYKYFPLKKKITLLIETDNRVSEIQGYVESNEPNIFSEDESTDISIICPDPFFYAANETQKTSFGGIEGNFEFPFSNESLTENLIEFSVIRTQIYRIVEYQGDYDIGVTIRIRAFGAASGIAIYNTETRETMTLNTDTLESLTGAGLTDGDEIVICTVRNNKSASLIRNGKTTNILNCIDRNSDWFQLTRGENTFAYTAETGSNNILLEIENKIAYEGV